jgi:multidrug resistance efflux pump
MEIVITAIYIWIIWLIWYKFKWLKPNLVWKVIWPSLLVAAIVLELISLGQYCPYSKNSFVWTYVYQMAPEYGGIVKQVYAEPNKPMKKGDKLFQMDPTRWQAKVNDSAAQLAAAKQNVKIMKAALDESEANLLSVRQQEKVLLAASAADKADIERISSDLKVSREELAQYTEAAKSSAVSKLKVEEAQGQADSLAAQLKQAEAKLAETGAQLTQLKIGGIPQAVAARDQASLAYHSKIGGEFTGVAQAQAQLDRHQFSLDSTTIVAPSDGYVVNLDLQAGVEIQMKDRVMTFVNGEPDKYWVVGIVPQFGLQRVKPGDRAEVMLKLYPSKVFDAEVVDVIWATGEAQIKETADIEDLATFGGGEAGGNFYAVKLALKNIPDGFQPRFGASGKSAIYPKSAPAFLVLLRQLEIRMDSWISYLYR